MNKFIGLVIVLSATVLYALLPPMLKKAGHQLPPFTIMAVSMFVLFILSLLGSFLFEGAALRSEGFKNTIPLLLAVGIVNFFSFTLILIGYRYFPIWQITMFGLLTPVIAGIFAYLILGEKVTINLFIGLAIMAVGLYVAIR